MTMRERILAALQGREVDRAPFVAYDAQIPVEKIWQRFGPGPGFGVAAAGARYTGVEHPNCAWRRMISVLGKT